MIPSLRSEFVKLSRRGVVVGTGCATAGVALLGTAIPYITGTTSDGGGGPMSSASTTEPGLASLSNDDGAIQGIATISKLLGVVVLVLVALSVANEYTHGTLKNLLVRHPKRATLLGGKLGALAISATTLALWATVIAVAASFALAPLNDVHIAQWTTASGIASIGTAAIGLVASNLAYASIGALLAVLLRAPATAIGIGVAWALLGEQLIGSLIDAVADVSAWLPGSLASGLVDTSDLGRISSSLALAAWVAGFTAMAIFVFSQREVDA